jgi:hypothetical protein
MRMMLIAGLMITLPAIVVILWFVGVGTPYLVLGALASLAVNSLPFLAAMYLIGKSKGNGVDLEH